VVRLLERREAVLDFKPEGVCLSRDLPDRAAACQS
jgi:hypothetical protein